MIDQTCSELYLSKCIKENNHEEVGVGCLYEVILCPVIPFYLGVCTHNDFWMIFFLA